SKAKPGPRNGSRAIRRPWPRASRGGPSRGRSGHRLAADTAFFGFQPAIHTLVIPAQEAARKFRKRWIGIARPSRRPLRGLLRMRNSLSAIKDLPHPEERPKGASRRTHDMDALLSTIA